MCMQCNSMGVAQYHAQHVQVQTLHSARHVTQHKHTPSRVCTDTPLYTPCHSTQAHRITCTPQYTPCHSTQAHSITCTPQYTPCHSTQAHSITCTPQYTPCHSTQAHSVTCTPQYTPCHSTQAHSVTCTPQYTPCHSTQAHSVTCTPQYTPCHSTHTAHHHVSATTPGPQQYDVQPLTLITDSGTQSQTAITHWQRSNQQRACTAAYSTESVKQTMRFTRNDTAA